jgi:hypothetical protein
MSLHANGPLTKLLAVSDLVGLDMVNLHPFLLTRGTSKAVRTAIFRDEVSDLFP